MLLVREAHTWSHFILKVYRLPSSVSPLACPYSSLQEMSTIPTTKIDKLLPGDEKTFPKPGDVVTVHYTGTLDNGEKFDSSRDRGIPFQCTIGVGQVIKGWDMTLPTLSVGSRAKLTVPCHEAYGSSGFPGLIPPNATLVFDVELLDVN